MNEENLFVYEEDGFCELRYTYGDLTKFERKSKKYDELQSNWNSLREWLERMIQRFIDIDNLDYVTFQVVRDKMNELEGGNNV